MCVVPNLSTADIEPVPLNEQAFSLAARALIDHPDDTFYSPWSADLGSLVLTSAPLPIEEEVGHVDGIRLRSAAAVPEDGFVVTALVLQTCTVLNPLSDDCEYGAWRDQVALMQVIDPRPDEPVTEHWLLDAHNGKEIGNKDALRLIDCIKTYVRLLDTSAVAINAELLRNGSQAFAVDSLTAGTGSRAYADMGPFLDSLPEADNPLN